MCDLLQSGVTHELPWLITVEAAMVDHGWKRDIIIYNPTKYEIHRFISFSCNKTCYHVQTAN